MPFNDQSRPVEPSVESSKKVGAMSELPLRHIDFEKLEAIACPCGTARRALMEDPLVPYSLHRTDISRDARVHYHKVITETYFFLECSPEAAMELDGVQVPVAAGQAIVVPAGTRHRAVGEMKVIIIASPKFDPQDEWFDGEDA